MIAKYSCGKYVWINTETHGPLSCRIHKVSMNGFDSFEYTLTFTLYGKRHYIEGVSAKEIALSEHDAKSTDLIGV